jgi:predicted P-loop ATPase
MFKNIDATLDKLDPDQSPELVLVLESARTRLEALVDSQSYDETRHGLQVHEVSDESIVQCYAEALAPFPFVENFTVGEFLAFYESNDEIVKQRTKRKVGRPKKSSSDRVAEMRSQREILSACLPGLRFNILTGGYEYLKQDGAGKWYYYTMRGDDLDLMYIRLTTNNGVQLNEQTVVKQVKEIAQSNQFNPIAAVMDEASERYPNLSIEEAKTFLYGLGTHFFGNDPNEPQLEGMPMRNSLIARYILGLAHLSRNFGQPPAWMPILIGFQGCGKSAFVRYLLPYERSLTGELSGQVATLLKEPYRLFTAFLWEFPEIDTHMKASNIEELKMLVTGQKDEYRRPYSSLPDSRDRQFAFIGTSNRDEIFVDPSGERRYIPISIPNGHYVPWRELVHISDDSEYSGTDFCWKLWAAANLLVTEKVFKPDYFRALNAEETKILSTWQRSFAQVDPWENSIIQEIISMGGKRFATETILEKIGVEPARQTNADRNRVRTVLFKVFGPDAVRKVTINMPGGIRRKGWSINQEFSLETSLAARVERLNSTQSGGSNDF